AVDEVEAGNEQIESRTDVAEGARGHHGEDLDTAGGSDAQSLGEVDVEPGVAIDMIGAALTHDGVVPGAAGDVIAEGAAEDGVVALAAVYGHPAARAARV